MCGLVGMIRTNQTGTPASFEKYMRLSLLIDSVRGEDSTGMFTVDEWNPKVDKHVPDVTIIKKAMCAMDFLTLPPVGKVMGSLKNMAYIVGHNRSATRGTIKNAFAHPFQADNITLVHNGTVHAWGKFHKYANYAPVDSAVVSWMLTQHSIEEIAQELTGGHCFIWHDAKDNSLNFFRNNDRPLKWADTDFGYVFASEDWMINAAAAHAEIKTKDIKNLDAYTHYKITQSTDATGKISFNITKKTYPNLKPIVTTTSYGVYGRAPYSQHFPTTDEVLAPFGLKHGDRIQIDLADWVPALHNARTGTAYGDSPVKDYEFFVQAHSISREFFNTIEEDTGIPPMRLYGTITSASKPDKHPMLPAVVKPTLVFVKDIYAVCEDKNMYVRIVNDWNDCKIEYISKEVFEAADQGKVPENSKEKLENNENKTEPPFHPLVAVKNEPKQSSIADVKTAEITNHLNKEVSDFLFRVPYVLGGSAIMTSSDFRAKSKDGCMECTADLYPDVIKQTVVKGSTKTAMHYKGNALIGRDGHMYCDECVNYDEMRKLH